MTDCLNETMRDRLPELALGLLTAADAAVVRAHMADCGACASEFAAIETSRLVLQASAPRVDVAAVGRAVTGALGAARPAFRVELGGAVEPAVARRAIWRSRQFLAAAASVLIVVSVAIPALDGSRQEPETPAQATAVAAASEPPAIAPATASVAAPGSASVPSSFAVSEGLANLSDEDLSTLLAELEGLEANVAAEPYSARPPLVDMPEGDQ